MKLNIYLLPILIMFTSKIYAETIYNCTVKDLVHLTDQGDFGGESTLWFSPQLGNTFTISDRDGVMHGQVVNTAIGYYPDINIAKGMFTSLVTFPESGRVTDLRIHLWKESNNKPFIYIDDFGVNITSGTCIKQ